jgi:predicted transcriptional regulator
MRSVNISAELLRELYVERGVGIERIAKLLGHSSATVWKYYSNCSPLIPCAPCLPHLQLRW